MSGSFDEEDISNGNRHGYRGGGGGGSDADDDEDEEDEEEEEEDNAIGKKKQQRFGFGKKLVLHQFTKAKNQFRRIRSKKSLLSSSSLSTSSSSRNVNTSNINRGKVVIIHGKGDDDDDATIRNGSVGCKFCFSRPNVLETPNGSPSRDPNDPKFTQSMFKSLIENNDFYSKECNPHIESLID